jgi:hypothetical protein
VNTLKLLFSADLEASYLIETGYVNLLLVDRDLASLTMQYLTFECFEPGLNRTQRNNLVRHGYAAFQDYAVVHWSDHLQGVLRGNPLLLQEQEDGGLSLAMLDFAHFSSEHDPNTSVEPSLLDIVPEREYLVKNFQHYRCYPSLCLIMNQLAQHTAQGPDAFDQIWSKTYKEAVILNRRILEECTSSDLQISAEMDEIQSFYGKNWFKCPKATCFFFHEGFKDLRSCETHVARHERPFRCTFPTCSGFKLGFVAAKDLDKHMKTSHFEEDHLAVSFTRIRKARGKAEKPEKTKPTPSKHPLNFQCHLCPSRYSRAYNLRSHYRTHEDERPFVCTVCHKAFTRQYDRKRHEILHSGEKKFECKGHLMSPQDAMWGCGRRFARADALGLHFRSESGQVCIRPLLEQEREERQKSILRQKSQDPRETLPTSLLAQFPDLANIDWTRVSNSPPGDGPDESAIPPAEDGEYYTSSYGAYPSGSRLQIPPATQRDTGMLSFQPYDDVPGIAEYALGQRYPPSYSNEKGRLSEIYTNQAEPYSSMVTMHNRHGLALSDLGEADQFAPPTIQIDPAPISRST